MDSEQQFYYSEFGYGDPRFTEDFSHYQSLRFDSLETPDPCAGSGQVNQPPSAHDANFNSGVITGQFNMNVDMVFAPSSLMPTSTFSGWPSVPVKSFEPTSVSIDPEPVTFPYFPGTALGPQIVALDDSEIQYRREGPTLNVHSNFDSLFTPQRMEPQSGRRPRAKYRRNNQKVEVGNNRVGKKGKLRCEACRKVRSKCVYLSLDSPCLHCAGKRNGGPCIKVWGPVKQHADVSRPPPTPIDQVIESENAMLLQFLYDGALDFYYSSILVQDLAKEVRKFFTQSITSLSLRYALLVYAGIIRNHTMSPLEVRNASLARQSLLKKSCETVNEEDLLASGVLAAMAYTMYVLYKEATYQGEYKVHLEGFMSILSQLSDDMEIKNASKFTNVGVMLRNLVLYIAWELPNPEFFRSYWIFRKFLGHITLGESIGFPYRALCWADVWIIEDIVGRALRSRLLDDDDTTEKQCVDAAVQDARDAIDDITTWRGAISDAWIAPHIAEVNLRLGICRIVLALRDTRNFVNAVQDPGVIQAVLSLYKPFCDFLQYARTSLEDDHRHGRNVRQALCFILLAIPVGVDLRSLEFATHRVEELMSTTDGTRLLREVELFREAPTEEGMIVVLRSALPFSAFSF